VPVAAAEGEEEEAASRLFKISAGPSLWDFEAEVDGALAPSAAAAAAPFSPEEGAFSPAAFDVEDGRRSLKSSFSSMPSASVVFARAEMSASMSSVKGGGAGRASSFGDDDAMSKGNFFARLGRAL